MFWRRHMKSNENKKICAKCGGRCCKQLPGICTPEDIRHIFPAKSIRESIKLAIKSGLFCFDRWDGDPCWYFIRPRLKSARLDAFDYSWGGGECVFLTTTGCSREFDERPAQCRALVPNKDGHCCVADKTLRGKYEPARRWHREVRGFRKIVKEVMNEEETDS